ncbi:Pinin-like protein 1 [Colletotrichum sidae]|uniref:Pinin-like protein 1 n=1 Tax=Colletotrichum sidae TaxID=1347389 RepID=A0A4R8TTS7_9PEZI|nr:Pinin-like protein 1 [Colletotrichum sidae]
MATVADTPTDPSHREPKSPDAEMSQKRKASEETEESSKRQRTDDARSAHDSQHSPPSKGRREADASAGRRAPLSKDEEKKRGRRLFGGLLSTLSQTTASTQQRKRREIEQRQQERVQKERAEDEKRKSEKLAKVQEVKLKEQIYVDERVMRARHRNLLAKAHSLQTKEKPHIFYRPWKLTKDQEDMIGDQIQEAKATIAREVEEFEQRREEHRGRYDRSRPPTRQEPPAPAPATVEAQSPAKSRSVSEALAGEDMAVDANPAQPPAQESVSHEAEPHDLNGDIVEDAEDTVIY